MASFASDSSRPPGVSEGKAKKRNKNSSPQVTISKSSDPKAVTATKIRKSSKRCLSAANLIEQRLEVLAQLDYKPLFSGRDKTMSGEMFDLRVVERAADIESLKAMLERTSETNPEEYQTAKNQYDSALTATEADFALLKMLILLREYATHTSRFLSFIDEYEPPDDLDLDFLGETNLEKISNLSLIDFSDVLEEATIILAQMVMVLNCSTYVLTPSSMCEDYVDAVPGKVIWKLVADRDSDFIETLSDLAQLSRDLTFSREMVRVRDGIDPDEEYKELIQELFGDNYINSANKVNQAVMEPVTGNNAFYSNNGTINNQGEIKFSPLKNYLNNKQGIMSVLEFSKQNVLIPETDQVNYTGKTYDTIDPLVDEAFSGENVLDFSKFSEIIEDFIAAFRRLSLFGRTSFRLLDKTADSDGAPRSSLPLVQNEQPLSPASITAAVYEVFNRRFASTLWGSLTGDFYDWLVPEHVNYNRVLAYLLIRDKTGLANEVFSAFMQDYEGGFLTVVGPSLPIEGTAEVDEDGEEIAGTEQMSELVYIKPGTTNPVAIGSGVGANLNSKIYKINKYYAEEVYQMYPANTLSQNENEAIAWPTLRTQYERNNREYHQYFGAPNPGGDQESGDLRLVNVMYLDKITVRGGEPNSESRQYYGSKIVAAEIVDAVLDVVRSLISPFAEVEPVEDGDPVFPFIPAMKNPYGSDSGYWGYSGAGYEMMSMAKWTNTVEEFDKLFTRTNDKTTYMRRKTLRDVVTKILSMFQWMMQDYDFLSPRHEVMNTNNSTNGLNGDQIQGVYCPSQSSSANKQVFCAPVCVTIKYMTTSGTPTYSNARESSGDCKSSSKLENHVEALSTILSDLLESSFQTFDSDVESIDANLPEEGLANPTSPATPALNRFASMLQKAKQENDMLAFQNHFLESYANRVDNYKQATIDLVSGEGSPLGEFVTMVRALGDPGTDILQNLTVNQLALKQVALEEERADVENAYLPTLSVLSSGEINSIHTLCDQNILKAPEGSTTRVLMVGIPLNTFDQNNVKDDFCIRVSYRDIEYPQLVFRSKSYKFDKDLYVLPEDLNGLRKQSSFEALLSSAKFSRIRVEVQESNDTTAAIELLDDIEKIRNSARERTDNKDVFSNLLVSEIMKLYYRVMLGISFSEVSFLSTSEDLKIPISNSSVSLADSMAENIQSLTSLSQNLSSNVQDLIGGVTAFESPDDFMPGEITGVDAALLSDLKNAYQTRLFSPELLRNRTLAAKMFDRIYAIPVDPDEFYIVPPGESQLQTSATDTSSGPETPEEILDFYLNAGIIEETGLESPYRYKLAPRRSAEGSMAMGSITVALTTVDDEAEGILGL